jgi:methanogenic corrinoid protein MtbC1
MVREYLNKMMDGAPEGVVDKILEHMQNGVENYDTLWERFGEAYIEMA